MQHGGSNNSLSWAWKNEEASTKLYFEIWKQNFVFQMFLKIKKMFLKGFI